MVNGNVFRRVVDTTTSAVLVVGPQGAGKSTNIGIQIGARYESRFADVGGRRKRVFECVQSDSHTPMTSDGFTSKTLNIGLYKASDQFGGFSYLDTAGMNEDRTENHRVWTRWSLSLLFSTATRIKCVVMVMDFRTLVAERAHGMRDLAKSFTKIVGSSASSQHFYESMIFLVTHGYEDGEKVDSNSVLKIAQAQHDEQDKQLKQMLKKSRPQTGKFQTMHEDTVAEIEDRVAIVTLLKTIMNAEGKVHMCFPDTPQASDRQRMIVQTMIENSKPISKQQLQDIVSARQSNNLQVMQVLAQLTMDKSAKLGGRSYAEILRLRGDNLQQLLGQLNQHKNRLHAIENDWRGVQRDKVDELERIKADHTRRMTADTEQINRLKISEKPTVIATREIKKSFPTSGWWALCMFGGGWGWGTTSAEETLSYNDVWFSKYTIRGGDYTCEVSNENRSSGRIDIAFKSTPRTNLNLEVDFFRPEKDTEETQRVVESLLVRIAALKLQVEDVGNQIVDIKNVGSANALVELCMAEKSRLETVDQDFLKQLDSPAVLPTDDFPRSPSEMSVLTNLAKLLSVLKDTHKLDAGLAAGTRDPIVDFLEQYHRVKKLEVDLMSGPGQKFISLQRQEDLVMEAQTEDAPPVCPTSRARVGFALASLSSSWCASSAMPTHLLDHMASNRASMATSMLAYGVLLKQMPAQDMQGAFGSIVIAMAIYVFSSLLFGYGVHTVAMQTDSLGRAAGNTGQQIQDLLEGLTSGGREALGEMTDRIVAKIATFRMSVLGGAASAGFGS